MAQIFSSDAQMFNGNVPLPAGVEVPALSTNFLTPPFGNAKGKVHGLAQVVVEAAATQIQIALYRNPDGENVVLVSLQQFVDPGTVPAIIIAVDAIDEIPDGRDVKYAMTIEQVDGGGDGQLLIAYIEATLISG